MNAIEKIHSLDAFGSRPGLERIQRFLNILGNPQDKLKFVHVAGTNGKGSTCQLLSSVLCEAGYKTGLFVSPYIVDFRERIQINGEMISGKILGAAVERTFPILEKLREDDCVITEFEYVMALEFLIHSEAECDIVVLETGMGGLLDCTNVIKPPLCSVITTIGLDHTAVLGNTIEEITMQKCGIIKSGAPAVSSAQQPEVEAIIEQNCREKGVELRKSSEIELSGIAYSLGGTGFEYKGKKMTLTLLGEHQVENAKTALSAIEVLRSSMKITDDDIVRGFVSAKNPARFELLSQNPTVILDGAHNPNGVEALAKSVKKYNTKSSAVLILGMLSDKDSKSSVKLLGGLFDKVFTVPVNNPRTLSSEALAEECKPYFDEVIRCETVLEALEKAYSETLGNDSLLVVAGSLYLAGEIRPLILKKTENS